jgi:hypothetical protein
MWLPLGARFGVDARFPRELESDPDSVWLEIVARLRPGVSTKEATSALHGVLVDNIGNTSHKFKPPQIELLSAVDGLSPVR